MLITRTSALSGITRTLDLPITEEQVNNYQKGLHIQHAFSNLSPDDREFILTGMTEDEWNQLINDDL